MFVYIKNEKMLCTTTEHLDSIESDEVIETNLTWDVTYEDGKVILLKDSKDVMAKKNANDLTAAEEKTRLEEISNSIEWKRAEAYKRFEKTLEVVNSQYTDNEQKTFDRKVIEARIVINWGESTFIDLLCKEDETVKELAAKILGNADMFETIYASAEVQLREELENI